MCNFEEAGSLTGCVEAPGWRALGEAILAWGAECAVITLGEVGVGVVTPLEAAFEPAPQVPVVDPTGAGDAVAAVAVVANAIWGMARTLSPDRERATVAIGAAIVVLAAFPAGLVIYWAWNNLLSIAQQWVIMRRDGAV